jgi:hypothetical protein
VGISRFNLVIDTMIMMSRYVSWLLNNFARLTCELMNQKAMFVGKWSLLIGVS